MDKLDLKHRPKRFSEIIGNAGVVSVLLARSKNGSLSGRSLLFGGPKGCGKTTLARIAARAMVCGSLVDGEPCNECDMCLTILSDSSVSVEEFDAASHGTVDRIRSTVDDLEYGSIDGSPRILILDEAHRLGPAAQDAMLKSMEDRLMVVILCTTEPQKIRPAVRDRVEEYPVRPPMEVEVVRWIRSICKAESIKYDDEAVIEIVKACGNSPRSCINAIEAIQSVGLVSMDAVRTRFRYNSMEIVSRVLNSIDSNPVSALQSLDDVLSSESPTWVRDTILHAISSGMRASLKVSHKYPASINFFARRGMGWAEVSKILSTIDKPSASDIEFSLISTSPLKIVEQIVQPEQSVQPVMNQTSENKVSHLFEQFKSTDIKKPRVDATITPSLKKPREMEIDGVVFSSNERLTTLDDKIESGRQNIPLVSDTPKVEFERSKVPMPEQEFARAFIQRIKK